MNSIRRQRLSIIVIILLVTTVALALIMYALRQNISLFYTPSQIFQGNIPLNKLVRVGGMVVKQSIVRKADGLSVQFKLTDFKQTVLVDYYGILPDLFREGQGVVAQGYVIEGHFKAIEVLAKHDANYIPPELKNIVATSSLKAGEQG